MNKSEKINKSSLPNSKNNKNVVIMKQPEVKEVGLKVMFMTSTLLVPQQKAAAWKVPALQSGWTESVMSEDNMVHTSKRDKSMCSLIHNIIFLFDTKVTYLIWKKNQCNEWSACSPHFSYIAEAIKHSLHKENLPVCRGPCSPGIPS